MKERSRDVAFRNILAESPNMVSILVELGLYFGIPLLAICTTGSQTDKSVAGHISDLFVNTQQIDNFTSFIKDLLRKETNYLILANAARIIETLAALGIPIRADDLDQEYWSKVLLCKLKI